MGLNILEGVDSGAKPQGTTLDRYWIPMDVESELTAQAAQDLQAIPMSITVLPLLSTDASPIEDLVNRHYGVGSLLCIHIRSPTLKA